MSENTQPNSQNDEVDLGQLFQMIGRGFKKIGDLISKLFGILFYALGKLAVFLLLFINTIIKHFVFVAIAGVIGFAIPYLLDKSSPKRYSASMLVSQNYRTGNVLYNNIERYSQLAADGDSTNLAKELNVDLKLASKFKSFSIQGLKNENQILEDYTNFTKDMDSIDKPSFYTYSENIDLSAAPIQSITVKAKSPKVFENLSATIVNAINENRFFIKEKKEILLDFKRQIEETKASIAKTDSLQKQYFEILNKYYNTSEDPKNSNASTLNVNLANNKDKINTREFELFEIQQKNRLKLVDLEAKMAKKQSIIDLQKDFESPVLVQGDYKELKIKLPIVFMLLVALFFVFRTLGIGNYVRKYGSKEQLLQK